MTLKNCREICKNKNTCVWTSTIAGPLSLPSGLLQHIYDLPHMLCHVQIMLKSCSNHVETWKIMFSLFKVCSVDLHMICTWNWTWTCSKPCSIIFNMYLSCSNSVLSYSKHGQVLQNMIFLFLAVHMISSTRTWWNMLEYDCSKHEIAIFKTWNSYVQNMLAIKFIFWTWW